MPRLPRIWPTVPKRVQHIVIEWRNVPAPEMASDTAHVTAIPTWPPARHWRVNRAGEAHYPFDRIIPAGLQGKRVLEIGCGMGLHTLELARRGAEVHAVD